MHVQSSRFKLNHSGAFRGEYHYRTTHEPAAILEAGDGYFQHIAHMVQPGDIALIEDEQIRWSFSVIFISADPLVVQVDSELTWRDARGMQRLAEKEAERAQAVIDKDKADLDAQIEADKQTQQKLVEERAAARQLVADRAAELEAKADEAGVVEIKWQGKGKFTVLAYGRKIRGGFDQREDALEALNNGALQTDLTEAREAWKADHGGVPA